jgi:hypothetical protein
MAGLNGICKVWTGRHGESLKNSSRSAKGANRGTIGAIGRRNLAHIDDAKIASFCDAIAHGKERGAHLGIRRQIPVLLRLMNRG